MGYNRLTHLILLCLGPLIMANSIQAQETGDKLVVHIRRMAVTITHVALEDKDLRQEVAVSLEKLDGVTGTRAHPMSAMVEARFDTNRTTGEQVANAAKKILEEKLTRAIEARNLPSAEASSKVFVKTLASDKVQLTSERFY